MLQKSFEEMGIPEEYGFKRLLFCAPAETLVVQTQSKTHRWLPERLYYRHSRSEQYGPIGTPGELTSQDDPVTSSRRPLLAYNMKVHTFQRDGEGIERHGGNWESVRVFDLAAAVETHVLDAERLLLPDGVKEAWIAKLLSFAENSDVLHVVAGLSGAEGGRSFSYHVCEVHIASGTMTPVVFLPAVFM